MLTVSSLKSERLAWLAILSPSINNKRVIGNLSNEPDGNYIAFVVDKNAFLSNNRLESVRCGWDSIEWHGSWDTSSGIPRRFWQRRMAIITNPEQRNRELRVDINAALPRTLMYALVLNVSYSWPKMSYWLQDYNSLTWCEPWHDSGSLIPIIFAIHKPWFLINRTSLQTCMK